MKALTVLWAYKKARDEMEDAVHFRKGERGIAIARDSWARTWQKRKQQAALFEAWLTHFLEGLE